MTRDIAAHVRLLEHGLPEPDERPHLRFDTLDHPVFPVRVEPWDLPAVGRLQPYLGGRMRGYMSGSRTVDQLKPPPWLQANRCGHRQAEPVLLLTGEHVACICVTCYEQLPVGCIDRQRRDTERIARCEHEDWIDITSFGQLPGSSLMCALCGTAGTR